VILYHSAFSYGVLLKASSTTLYGGFSRLSGFLGDFFSR
jgi:hypothetical protein